MKYQIIRKAGFFVLFLEFSLFIISCDLSFPPAEPNQPIRLSELKKFSVRQIFYDSLHVESLNNLSVPRMEFRRVDFGVIEQASFSWLASTVPTYAGEQGNYVMSYETRLRFNNNRYLLPFVVRYVYTDGDFVDIDTSLYTLAYPYPSTQLFVTNSIHTYQGMFFQDIARLAGKFFYHPIGAEGLFEYDLNSKTLTELIRYGGGDHIAADSTFVFADIGHYTIWRYDLNQKTSSKIISYPDFSFFISGMDAYEKTLYILLRVSGASQIFRYTFDGLLVDSITYPKNTAFMAINEGILYSVDYDLRLLSRFDLASKSFLPNILPPAFDGDGIKVYQDYFYFTDYSKRVVGRVLMEEIRDARPIDFTAGQSMDLSKMPRNWRE